jgi:hypothetical protein
MAQKVQRWTRKKLTRLRKEREAAAKAEARALRAADKALARGAKPVDEALKGCEDR